jgi:hypothetical protein
MYQNPSSRLLFDALWCSCCNAEHSQHSWHMFLSCLWPGTHCMFQRSVPKGTRLLFPTFSYMRDPSIWPRALEFLPERHIQPGNEQLAPSNWNAFMPFGHGSRYTICWMYGLSVISVTNRCPIVSIAIVVIYHSTATTPPRISKVEIYLRKVFNMECQTHLIPTAYWICKDAMLPSWHAGCVWATSSH